MRTGHIGSREAIVLLAIYIGAKAFISCPSQLVYLMSTSAWITGTLAVIPAAAGMITSCLFVSRFNCLPFQRCLEVTVGRHLGKALGLGFAAFLILADGFSARESASAVKTAILPETPILVIEVTAAALSTYTASFGLEALGRYALLTFGAVGFVFLITLAQSAAVFFSIHEIFPLWGVGLARTLKGSIPCSSLYAEGFAIGLLLPHVSGKSSQEGIRIALTSLSIAAFVIVSVVFVSIATFTASASAQTLFPMIQIARMWALGPFVERVEGLLVLTWLFWITTKIVLGILLVSELLADVFGVRHWKPLLIPVAAGIVGVSLAFPKLEEVFMFQITVFRSLGWIVAFLGPAILLGIAALRKVPRKAGAGP